ncbi:MAG: YfhO family protein [Acidobacteria bacterium]|nr:YfhO family protein [Acidobacteriota bacterium]
MRPGFRLALLASAIAALAAVCWAPVLWQGQTLYERDLFNFHYPLWAGTAAELRAGRIPLWNAQNNFGQNISGNPNYLLWYPPAWIRAVLDPLTAMNVFILGHLLLGGIAFGRLVRRWGISGPVATVAGLAYALSGVVLSLHCVLNLVPYVALAPALLLTLEWLLQDGGRRAVACLALAGAGVGTVFEPVMAVGLAAVAVIRSLVHGWGFRGRRGFGRTVGRISLALLLAMAIAFPVTLEGLRLLNQNPRTWTAEAGNTLYSLHPARFIGLWIPNPFGMSSGIMPDFAGGRYTDGRQPYLASMFIGLSSLVLIGLSLGGAQRRTAAWACGGGMAFLLVAASPWLPGLGRLFGSLPLLGWGRYTEKLAFYAAGAFLLAAAVGLERVYRCERLPLRGWTEWMAPGVALAAVLIAGVRIPGSSLMSLVAAPLVAVGVAVAVLLVAEPPRIRLPVQWRSAAIGLCLLAELVAGNRFAVPITDRQHFTEAVPVIEAVRQQATSLATERIAVDAAPVDIRYFGASDSDVWISRFHRLAGYAYPGFTSGGYYAFNDTQDRLEGVGQLQLRRWFEQAALESRIRLMQRLGVGWYLSPRRLDNTGLQLIGAFPTGSSHRYGLYRVMGGQGRFQLWSTWRPAHSAPVTAGDLATEGPAAPFVDAAGPVPSSQASGGAPPGRVAHVSESGGVLRLELAMATDGLLVVRDVWYPGWTARLDNRIVPIHRADYLFRAVTVPAGTHQLEMRYEPAGWTASWLVSGAGFISVLVLGLWPRRRREDTPAPAEPRNADGA